MYTRWHTLSARRTAGAGVLEAVAAYAVAAVVIAAVALSAGQSNGRIKPFVDEVICKIKAAAGIAGSCAGGGEPEPPTDEENFDPKPDKCKITERAEQVNAVVKIAFIELGENAGFIETTYSDGSVTYTVTDGASVGVTGGFGGNLDIGKLERGASVDFGAGIEFTYGSTWTFADAEEATRMKDQLNDYLVQQETLKHDTYGGYALWLTLSGNWVDPPKPPNQQVSTVEVDADVTGNVGISLPFDPGDPDSDVPDLKLVEAGVKFGGSGKWTQITDTEAKTTTWTTDGEVFGEASAAAGPLAGELKGVLGSSLSITRNEQGEVVNLELVTTREAKATGTVNSGQPDLGGNGSQSGSEGQMTITTTSLDVTNPEQRAIVNAWLDRGGAVTPETYLPSRLVPGDPFQNLMYTNGTVSNVQYDNVSDKAGFAAEVKLGVAFGVDFSLETTESRATDATYLDAPGADGVRRPVDFPECES